MERLGGSHSAGRSAGPAGSDPPLDDVVAALCARARARHPELAVPDEAFAAHLARCNAPLSAERERIHAEDLFLSCAALAGDAAAVATLRRDCDPAIRGYAGHIISPPGSIEDLTQTVWAALLVGEEDKGPRLAAYSGIGPLTRFVGIAAQRIALRGLERRDAAARTLARVSAEVTAVIGSSAELEFMRERYRTEFERALRTGLDALEDRLRLILRLRVVDGLSVERISKLYGVSQATISRWIEKARREVLGVMRRTLREQVALSESDFDALVTLMISQVDLSISELLATRR